MHNLSKTAWLAVAALTASGTAMAQDAAPAPNTNQPQPTVAFRNSAPGLVTVNATDQPLEAVLKDVSAQSKSTIWVEPGITRNVTATLNRQPVESALTALTGEGGPYWAKVEIVHKANETVPAEPLFNLVRAFFALPSDRMAVGLAGGAGTVTLSRGGMVAPEPAIPEGYQRVTAYVVAKRTATLYASPAGTTGDQVVDQFSVTNQQRQELLNQMTPDQRSKAMQQDLLYMMQLSPEARQQMRQDMRNAWRTLPDDVRQQLRQNRGFGRGPGGRRGNRGGNGNNGGNNAGGNR